MNTNRSIMSTELQHLKKVLGDAYRLLALVDSLVVAAASHSPDNSANSWESGYSSSSVTQEVSEPLMGLAAQHRAELDAVHASVGDANEVFVTRLADYSASYDAYARSFQQLRKKLAVSQHREVNAGTVGVTGGTAGADCEVSQESKSSDVGTGGGGGWPTVAISFVFGKAM